MIKSIIKKITPSILIDIKNNIEQSLQEKKFKNLTTKEVFQLIYEKKIWTPEKDKKNFKYYSGFGSHDPLLTKNYLKKMKFFLSSFKNKPSIVEIGCGDFQVSLNLVSLSKKFYAFDVHNKLINHNKKRYKHLKKVKFKALDITKKKPPKAEICIVRCVLQHLSNAMIKKFLTNVENKFEFLIITEHVPSSNSFKSNQDITSGPGIRLHKNSGVDLAEYPFNLKYKKKRILNITKSDLIEGCLKTSLYQIK